MHPSYKDIRSRIPEEPKWWDANGVPRYDSFHPELSSSIYAKEVALLEIACQRCKKRFRVEVIWHPWNWVGGPLCPSLRERMNEWDGKERPPLHYGDPPRHDCVGDAMSSNSLQALELWYKESFAWAREGYE